MKFELEYRSFPDSEGPLRYARVPWDSELYGIPVYELQCEGATVEVLDRLLPRWLSEVWDDGGCFAYTKIPTSAVHECIALTRNGFYPVEALFELYLPLAKFVPALPTQNNMGHLSLMQEDDLPEVVSIAGSAFNVDRLHLDPNLSSSKADQRYAKWVENGFRAGERIFVYKGRKDGRLMGFLHTREASENAVTLSLSAVDTAVQGVGIGAMMYQDALAECKALGYKFVVTRISINNLAIVNLLSKFGFRFKNAVMTFHWFDQGSQKL